MSTPKERTNRKWTSTDRYKDGYDRIFSKPATQEPEVTRRDQLLHVGQISIAADGDLVVQWRTQVGEQGGTTFGYATVRGKFHPAILLNTGKDLEKNLTKLIAEAKALPVDEQREELSR